MKYLDRVRVISDAYESEGIKRGDEGHILNAEIRFNKFNFYREREDFGDDEGVTIKVGDLELVSDGEATDEDILEDLPLHNPNWWCKVENGYILNLKGEKKNKIPYDYDS